MHIFWFCAGIGCLFFVLLDAFQTVILPRRAVGRFRITYIFYSLSWWPWASLAGRMRNPRKRETALSYFGPLSLMFLIVFWAAGLLFGFAMLFYSLRAPVSDPQHPRGGIESDLYISGTTIFTLGLGDLTPHSPWARLLVVLESGTGLGFLALVISYFPVLYGAFSRREVSISLLDARAGSPPTAIELIRRHAYKGGDEALALLLVEWERWAAELLESHISYPLLCYFRSQHSNQSWLSALTAVLDLCALLIADVQEHPARQAQLTFAMARHALVDLSQTFGLTPVAGGEDRLPKERFDFLYKQLSEIGIRVCQDCDSMARLQEMRQLYEGYAKAFSEYLYMPLPPWSTDHPRKDNWQSVAKVRAQTEAVTPASRNAEAVAARLFHDEEHHLF